MAGKSEYAYFFVFVVLMALLKSSLPLVFRSVGQSDQAADEAFLALYSERGAQCGLDELETMTSTEIAAFMHDSRLHARVVFTEGQPIGFCVGEGKGGDCYRSHGIYVQPDFRQRGVGQTVKEFQIVEAYGAGFATMLSEIDVDDKAGMRIHEKMGADFYPEKGGVCGAEIFIPHLIEANRLQLDGRDWRSVSFYNPPGESSLSPDGLSDQLPSSGFPW